jgi:DNA-directed RNA polymerase subunit K/omega
MELDATERLVRSCSNRYEAVLLVAKHARRLNTERLREKSDEEETDEAQEKQKVIIQALQNVLDGKVEFERSKRA